VLGYGRFFGYLSEVATLAPTYEYGYVGFVGCFVFHSGSIITRGWVGWKGDMGSEQYVSCMFHVCFGLLVYFLVFSCRNCGIVRITEGTEDAEVRGNCLNQDFQDYRIFRIRGDCQNR